MIDFNRTYGNITLYELCVTDSSIWDLHAWSLPAKIQRLMGSVLNAIKQFGKQESFYLSHLSVLGLAGQSTNVLSRHLYRS